MAGSLAEAATISHGARRLAQRGNYMIHGAENRRWPGRIPRRMLAVLTTTAVIAGLAGVPGVAAWTTANIGADTALVSLASTQTALIMNGTFEPVVTPEWISEVMTELLTPALGAGYTGEPMDTPEEFWPVSGLTSLTFNKSIKVGYGLLDARVDEKFQAGPSTPLAVFGYSQSAIVAAVEKRNLAAECAGAEVIPPTSFAVIGNPYRPNGGILARIPLLADVLTPSTHMTSTPTDTPFGTVDIARQYDVWADFPAYPLNLVSVVNAVFGVMNHWYLPESVNPVLKGLIPMVSIDPASPDYLPGTTVEQYGDTAYYFVPSESLPMFYPLRWMGLGPLVDVVEPLVRVFVELGYARDLPAGQVVRARLIPGLENLTLDNATQFVSDVDSALRQGAEALADLFRPNHAAVSPPAARHTPAALSAAALPLAPAELPATRARPSRAAAATAPAINAAAEVELTPAAADVAATAPVREIGSATGPSTEPRPRSNGGRTTTKSSHPAAATDSSSRPTRRAYERN